MLALQQKVVSARRAREIYFTERMEPADWQALNHPEIGRVRKVNSRLLEALSPDQLIAWDQIAEAWMHIHVGRSVGIAQYEDYVPSGQGGEGITDRVIRLYRRYEAWREMCEAHDFDASAAIDILCKGNSLRSVAKLRMRNTHWPMENLKKCIDLYFCR